MCRVCGVVILYNPSTYVLQNIESYADKLDILYVIDNSEKKNLKVINNLKCGFSNLVYIDNKGNKGIANALNTGAKLAIKNRATWLLTMDQDSKFENNDFKKMMDFIKNNKTDNIGIVSPIHDEKEVGSPFFELKTMTSGSLLNLKIYIKIGAFLNKLFIDGVDIEYCLRLKKAGYKIVRINDVILNHNLGNTKKYKFLWFEFYSTNHDFIRRYYITRNRLFIWSLYKKDFPKFIRFEKRVMLKEIVKILLVEKDKIKKIIYMLRGCLDYLNGRFGEI